jgi:hypothetical protein
MIKSGQYTKINYDKKKQHTIYKRKNIKKGGKEIKVS